MSALLLSAAQEERLKDIANGEPHLRGTRATHRVLDRNGLVVFDRSIGCYQLTHFGIAVITALRERAALAAVEVQS